MNENVEEAEVVKPEFNPNKNYQWKAEDIFPLKGGSLHVLKQVLTSVISTPEAQNIIGAYESLKLVDTIIKEGVEEGKILPVENKIEE